MKTFNQFKTLVLALCGALLSATPLFANLPGGGTNGPNVTLTDNGTTVTIANGTMSIVITKSSAQIGTINYTFNNTGSTQTLNLVSGNPNGGKLYWENSNNEGLSFTYNLVNNPATNGGNYAEVSLVSTTVSNIVMDVHFSMLRGSTGFYVAVIWSHRSIDGAFSMGECRDNIYAGSIFNWMSVDANRNRLMEVSGGTALAVQGAPQEVTLWTTGLYAGLYEDKYKYSADFGDQRVWGWSSVGAGGKNIGLWNILASSEYYNGGPMKRELMSHIGTTILNMLNGGHYGGGSDGTWGAGEVWTKVSGPYFIYCNNITNNITATNVAAQALYTNAVAQAEAELTAWPYYWFVNTNYAPAAGRGMVAGQITINDTFNPNASASNLWVGVVQQPITTSGTYDFQKWVKPYQFWTHTDANGNFAISNVIAGANYTLYAYGPGAAGTFQSQAQAGGSPPNTVDIPTPQFSVTVTGGTTNNLSPVVWTPARVGPTVFEIGYPDRTGRKFRHGEDFWVGDIGPSASAPSPVWSKWLAYPFDFTNGPVYNVGQSRWTTDWNFIQPVVVDSQGNDDPSTSTINFNLAKSGTTASLYLAIASSYQGPLAISVNGTAIAGANGYDPAYDSSGNGSDASIREGIHGIYSDNRITFAGNLLHTNLPGTNPNTITITMRKGGYFANHSMYDYIRLELTGYVPPPPASAAAYAGNNCVLVSWPVTPGATSYNLLRTTNSGSNYVSVTNGVIGPVCGSGFNNATWLDTTVGNGTNYYYVVRSVNPVGSSTNSPESPVVTPSSGMATAAPAAPAGLTVTGSGHQSVSLSWPPVSGANFYTVWRSTLFNTGGGGSNVLGTIVLNNADTGTNYTDVSPTDGAIYRYFVTATGAGGTSSNSPTALAKPLPSAPATPPPSVTAAFYSTTNIMVTWTAVPGAVGYIVSRSTSVNGPYTFLMSVTETVYYDIGLNAATVYYYRVQAVNDTAVSANVTDAVNSQQVFPPSLSATATNAQVTLTWPATTGATSYSVKRGTTVGGESTTVVTGYAGTTYTNTGLANGTTYYYVVTATGAGGTSGNSPEASATPFATSSGIWINPAGGNWGDSTGWIGGGIASGSGSTADFSTLALPANATITLDTPRTISGLRFGDTSAAYNWSIAGTNTLTLGTSPNVTVVNDTATINAAIAGTAGLAKYGPGTLTLDASNSFSGGVTVGAGSLTLDFTPSNAPVTNIVSNLNALTSNGGALQIIGSGGTTNTQAFTGTAFTAGITTFTAAPASGTNNPTLTLAAFGTVPQGVTVRFNGPATTNGNGNVPATATIITTTVGAGTKGALGNDNAAGSIGHYATAGLYDWAGTDLADGTAGVSPYTVLGGSQVAGFYQTTFGGNFDMTANFTTGTGQQATGTLRFNTPAATTFTVASSSGTTAGLLTCGGILVTPKMGANNALVATTGNNVLGTWQVVRTTSNGSQQGIIWQNNILGYLTFTAAITDGRQGTSTTTTITKAGAGTVVFTPISGGNSYSGQTYINEGAVVIANDSGLGTPAAAAQLNLNGGTVVANGTFALDNAGANLRPVNLLANGGGLAATAGNTLTVDGVVGSGVNTGPLTIGLAASAANGNVAGLVPGTGAGTANTTPLLASGTVVLTNANYYTGGTLLQSGTLAVNGINALGGANYGGLTFNGGTLQYAPAFTGNGSGDLTSIGSAGVTVAAGGGMIDLNGNSLTYAGSIGNNGSGALTVKSSLAGGILNLLGANTYQGNTTVTNATLLAGNLTGSATGSGDVFVLNGASIGGDGSVAGSINVAAGGTLAPGSLSNSLSIGNNLNLATGSTTLLQIQRSPPANGAVNVSGNLNAGGTLIVTNLGGALAYGDSFNVLNAAGLSGSFNSLVLPPLTGNLIWNTNLFLASGTLAVTTVTSPVINSILVDSDGLVFSGNNGPASWSYVILSTTNLAAPQWTPLSTNQFDFNGNFSVTNTFDPTQPQTFYQLQLQ